MTNVSYPALLNRRARIFASLNRLDLVFTGSSYLFLSKLGVSGILTLVLSLVFLFLFKLICQRLEKGFFSMWQREKSLDWHMAIGGNNEEK